MVPLKRPNKHLPNVLWNISLPLCLKSFWCLGVTFSKKTSSEEPFPLMTSGRPTTRQQFQLGLATVDILLHWGNSQKDLWFWLWIWLLLDKYFIIQVVLYPVSQCCSWSPSALWKEFNKKYEILRSSESNWQRCHRGNLLKVWTGVSSTQWTRNLTVFPFVCL